MNKGRRNELVSLKFKKRLKQIGLSRIDFSFKRQGRPCSCFICKKPRYKRENSNMISIDKWNEILAESLIMSMYRKHS